VDQNWGKMLIDDLILAATAVKIHVTFLSVSWMMPVA
jgi:hypothetical protein